MEKVTICTNWDGSGYYPIEYVNRLYRACLRNTDRAIDFVLYAGPEAKGKIDGLNANIRVVPIDLPHWWSKCEFWKHPTPGVNTETRLWIDLDVVVVGSLDVLIDWPSKFCCSRDWTERNAQAGHVDDANDGVTLLRGDAGSWLWDEYVRHGKPTWKPFDPTIDHSPLPLAMMTLINSRRGCCDLYPTELCASYKYTVQKYGLPEGCATVHFHGRPKQHEVDELWIKDCWK